ncbi:hypothetical protein [Burkholderia pseudomultivorans]|uniref:hypothetical protein n=1 Tax=Burkholderia pseudomultivorans TaxID=1207504 RepID=UPI0012DA7168|nr:hypothetical protein [Burkholderia pseudomultivorans]
MESDVFRRECDRFRRDTLRAIDATSARRGGRRRAAGDQAPLYGPPRFDLGDPAPTV